MFSASYFIYLNNRFISISICRLSDRAKELSNAADRTPPKKYLETMTILTSFTNNIDSVLLSEHAVMSDEKTMLDRVKRFQELQDTLKSHQMSFAYVNKVGQDLITKMDNDEQSQKIKEELQELNTKWCDMPIILEERLQKLSKGKFI